jgi:hypothetical protein
MLGFASPPHGVEISNRNMIYAPTLAPGALTNTDEADDEFDEHVVSMSEGRPRSSWQKKSIHIYAKCNSCQPRARAQYLNSKMLSAGTPLTCIWNTALHGHSRHLFHGHFGSCVLVGQHSLCLDCFPRILVRCDPGAHSCERRRAHGCKPISSCLLWR